MNLRVLILQHDNAPSNSSRLTVKFLKLTPIKVIEHPLYSTDLAMCDCELSLNLKKYFTWASFSCWKWDWWNYKSMFVIDAKEWMVRRIKFSYKSALIFDGILWTLIGFDMFNLKPIFRISKISKWSSYKKNNYCLWNLKMRLLNCSLLQGYKVLQDIPGWKHILIFYSMLIFYKNYWYYFFAV